LGFVAIPVGSGTVVVVTDDVAANVMTRGEIDDAGLRGFEVEEVLAVEVVVVDTVALRVSPVPVCTVTSAPGVTSAGL